MEAAGALRVGAAQRVAHAMVRLVDLVVPARPGLVALATFPAIDDTALALLRSGARPHTVMVIADDIGEARRRMKALSVQVPVRKRMSPRGIWAFARSHVCLSTHGIWGTRPRPRGKSHASTWHGELGKIAGLLDGEPPKAFDRIYVSNSTSKLSKIAEMGVHPDAVLLTGQPRNALLTTSHPGRGSRPYWIWAPTYRASAVGYRRVDGDGASFEEFVGRSLGLLETILEGAGVDLWLRFHPHAAQPEVRRSHVRDAGDDELLKRGMSFYELLGGASGLITDFSSVWLDFLQVDRPILFAASDRDSYLSDRRMILEPYDAWFPGTTTTTAEGLADEVQRVLSGTDRGSARRAQLRAMLCPPLATPAVDAVWEDLATLTAPAS